MDECSTLTTELRYDEISTAVVVEVALLIMPPGVSVLRVEEGAVVSGVVDGVEDRVVVVVVKPLNRTLVSVVVVVDE